VEKGGHAREYDDLRLDELPPAVEPEDADDRKAREAEMHAQIELLEARVKAARFAGA
jgi:hypothetical protein